MRSSTSDTDLPTTGTHGEIRYLHNSGASEITFNNAGSNPIAVPPNTVYEIMYLAGTGLNKWFVVGTG